MVTGHGTARRLGTRQARRPLGLGGRLLALAAASVVGWSVAGLVLQYVRTYTLAREAVRLEHHRQELLTENASLIGEIQRLRTDDQYLEQLARQQLGMLRPGEMELVIVRRTPPVRQPTERDDAPRGMTRHEDRSQFVRGLAEFTVRGIREALGRFLHRFPQTTP